jgi:hypothetical protein
MKKPFYIIYSCIFLLLSCTVTQTNVATLTCFEKAVSNLDRLLTIDEKKKLLASKNVIISKKFGVIKIKIIKAFSLDDSNTCIPKYFLSNYGISDVIEISGRLIEKYKIEAKK